MLCSSVAMSPVIVTCVARPSPPCQPLPSLPLAHLHHYKGVSLSCSHSISSMGWSSGIPSTPDQYSQLRPTPPPTPCPPRAPPDCACITPLPCVARPSPPPAILWPRCYRCITPISLPLICPARHSRVFLRPPSSLLYYFRLGLVRWLHR